MLGVGVLSLMTACEGGRGVEGWMGSEWLLPMDGVIDITLGECPGRVDVVVVAGRTVWADLDTSFFRSRGISGTSNATPPLVSAVSLVADAKGGGRLLSSGIFLTLSVW